MVRASIRFPVSVRPPSRRRCRTLDDPACRRFRGQRSYVGDSLVLCTVFRTSTGDAALTDAAALRPGSRGHDIGLESPHVLLRRIEGIAGETTFEIVFEPSHRVRAHDAAPVGDVGDELFQIMYGVEGEPDLSEHTLDHLRGYRESRPVRIGNEAWTHGRRRARRPMVHDRGRTRERPRLDVRRSNTAPGRRAARQLPASVLARRAEQCRVADRSALGERRSDALIGQTVRVISPQGRRQA